MHCERDETVPPRAVHRIGGREIFHRGANRPGPDGPPYSLAVPAAFVHQNCRLRSAAFYRTEITVFRLEISHFRHRFSGMLPGGLASLRAVQLCPPDVAFGENYATRAARTLCAIFGKNLKISGPFLTSQKCTFYFRHALTPTWQVRWHRWRACARQKITNCRPAEFHGFPASEFYTRAPQQNKRV